MNAKRFFFILIGVSVFGAGLIAAIIILGNGLVANKAQKIRESHTDSDLVDTKITDTKKLAKKITDLADVADISAKFLPNDKDQLSLLAEIYAIAKSFDIQLKNVSFNASGKGPSTTSQTEELKEAPGVRVYPFNTGIDCVSYDNFIKFLERIELNKRKAQVVSIDIHPVENSSETCSAGNIIVNNLKIEVYLKNEGQAATTSTTNK